MVSGRRLFSVCGVLPYMYVLFLCTFFMWGASVHVCVVFVHVLYVGCFRTCMVFVCAASVCVGSFCIGSVCGVLLFMCVFVLVLCV